jgi:hypothetical protein
MVLGIEGEASFPHFPDLEGLTTGGISKRRIHSADRRTDRDDSVRPWAYHYHPDEG